MCAGIVPDEGWSEPLLQGPTYGGLLLGRVLFATKAGQLRPQGTGVHSGKVTVFVYRLQPEMQNIPTLTFDHWWTDELTTSHIFPRPSEFSFFTYSYYTNYSQFPYRYLRSVLYFCCCWLQMCCCYDWCFSSPELMAAFWRTFRCRSNFCKSLDHWTNSGALCYWDRIGAGLYST